MRLAWRPHPWLLIGVASVALGLPLLVLGFPLGHDSPWHLIYQKHFAAQFWEGELYPRWLAGANAELGSAMFFIYGPVPYWVGSLVRPVVSWLGAPDLESVEAALSAFVGLLAAGLAAYLWLRGMTSAGAAAAGAVIYMMMPYHLMTDLYIRSALAEHWAFVWMPLVLYFTRRLAEGRRAALPGLAVAYALLIMSHLFSALLFSGFAAAYAWLLLPERGRRAAAARLVSGWGLGLALSAIYLAPVSVHARFMAVERLNRLPSLHYANNFLPFSLTRGDGITLVTVLTLAVAGWGFVRTPPPATRDGGRERRFWLAAGLISVAMMLPVAHPVWRALPVLQAVQFPWRFNIVLVVSATALVTMALGRLPAAVAQPRTVGLLVLPWVLTMSAAGLVKTSQMRHHNAAQVRALVAAGYEGPQMLLWVHGARWDAAGLDDLVSLRASTEQVRHEQGGQASVMHWAPREVRLGVRAEREGTVVVRRFYYPGWQAQAAGRAAALRVEPTDETGLIRVFVPAGAHEVTVRLDGGPAERLGTAVSGVCLAVLMFLCWRRVGQRGCAADPNRVQ